MRSSPSVDVPDEPGCFPGPENSHFKTHYKMPVLFFTQLMGLAFGEKPEKLGFGSEFVSAREAMSRIGVTTPERGCQTCGQEAIRPADAAPTRQSSSIHAKIRGGQAMSPSTDPKSASASTFATAGAICWCGGCCPCSEWAGKELAQDGVVVSRDYKFMCSSLGQELIEKDIKEQGLTRVVVAACSPHLHERTFRNACERAGVNPYLFEMTNVANRTRGLPSIK